MLVVPTDLREIPSRLDLEGLADLARTLLAAEPIWQATVQFDATARRPVRLVATETFEAWVIGWVDGQGLEFHDHGDSAGAFVVAAGCLDEITIERRAGGGSRERRRCVGAGRVRPLPEGVVHGVQTCGTRPATSLHVYSPPLTTMTHYDATGLHPVTVERIEPETPVLAPAATAALLRGELHV